jgi:hypothetical protein
LRTSCSKEASVTYLMPALMKIPYLDLFSELFNYGLTTLILAISERLCRKFKISPKTRVDQS